MCKPRCTNQCNFINKNIVQIRPLWNNGNTVLTFPFTLIESSSVGDVCMFASEIDINLYSAHMWFQNITLFRMLRNFSGKTRARRGLIIYMQIIACSPLDPGHCVLWPESKGHRSRKAWQPSLMQRRTVPSIMKWH